MTDTHQRPPIAPTSTSEIIATVARIRSAFDSGALDTLDDRRVVLDRLESAIVASRNDITEALSTDLGKSPVEAWTTEIGFTLGQIRHARRNLKRWSRRRRVALKPQLRPGTAGMVPSPLGTVCVIAPWNYPVQLVLAPVVAALAAGNTVVVKPSEVAPATEAVLTEMLREHLGDVIGVVNGGAEQTGTLLEQRFDHIFYTGNGTVGRIIMRAAAEHLTPVTLELGGKSPAIVTASADPAIAARRIAWGKFINAGQTCVAPDYVLVDDTVGDRLIEELTQCITEFFGSDPSSSPDYGRIINEHHHDRLTALLAAGTNGRVVVGGDHNRDQRYIAPTVLVDTPTDSPVMQNEIFGPILPVLRVNDLEMAIAEVCSRPHPLALYLFSTDEADQRRVLEATRSGGVLFNHTLLHLAAENLPFGGIGDSGMGAYHGQIGFDTFSHLRPVMRRPMKPDPRLLYPPYGRVKRRILERFL